MARVNYAHGKRQREIANKAKREEKLQRKAERSAQVQNGIDPDLEGGVETTESSENPASDSQEG
jgi:hypothetical protein